ncbi:hypothetical protein SRHO_G00117280 [Serrasalmus rhombeus]
MYLMLMAPPPAPRHGGVTGPGPPVERQRGFKGPGGGPRSCFCQSRARRSCRFSRLSPGGRLPAPTFT